MTQPSCPGSFKSKLTQYIYFQDRATTNKVNALPSAPVFEVGLSRYCTMLQIFVELPWSAASHQIPTQVVKVGPGCLIQRLM
jgi:hypothetical protein